VKEKTTNVPRFEIGFILNFALFSTDFTCVNGSTFQLVFSLFRALREWGRHENERYAKCRMGRNGESCSSSPQFPPVLFFARGPYYLGDWNRLVSVS